MGEYFKSEHENILNKLEPTADSMLTSAKAMSQGASDLSDQMEKLSKYMGTTNWTEQGATEFSDLTIATLKASAETIQNNIESGLVKACSLAVDLLAALKDLKERDTTLTNMREELSRLRQSGSEEDYGLKYTIKTAERNIDTTVRQCKEALDKVDNLIDSIKDLNGNVQEVTISKASIGDIADYSGNQHLIQITYNGKQYYVVNTKTPVLEYAKYVQEAGVWQRYILGGECMLLSQYYAKDMLTGNFTSQGTMVSGGGGPATRMNSRVTSEDDPNVILKYIYEEACKGRPTVLQVTQVNPNARHLVTVVGFDASVRGAADLTPDKIFVLDCADGQLQTLDGHNRRLRRQNGVYLAYGATQEFLDKEVNV